MLINRSQRVLSRSGIINYGYSTMKYLVWALVALVLLVGVLLIYKCRTGGSGHGEPLPSAQRSVKEQVVRERDAGIRRIPEVLEQSDPLRYYAEADAALARSIDSLPAEKFDALLCELGTEDDGGSLISGYVTKVLAQRGKRAELVALLSQNPPFVVSRTETLEVWLAEMHFIDPPPLAAPILVLVEAYQRATKPTAKARLLTMLATGFPSIRKEYLKSDDSFVNAVAEWYRSNMKNIEMNPKYGHFEQNVELFVPKMAGAKM